MNATASEHIDPRGQHAGMARAFLPASRFFSWEDNDVSVFTRRSENVEPAR
jgi:hypothetical protein